MRTYIHILFFFLGDGAGGGYGDGGGGGGVVVSGDRQTDRHGRGRSKSSFCLNILQDKAGKYDGEKGRVHNYGGGGAKRTMNGE